MQVKLKVIGGKNDGREIKISVPEFITVEVRKLIYVRPVTWSAVNTVR